MPLLDGETFRARSYVHFQHPLPSLPCGKVNACLSGLAHTARLLSQVSGADRKGAAMAASSKSALPLTSRGAAVAAAASASASVFGSGARRATSAHSGSRRLGQKSPRAAPGVAGSARETDIKYPIDDRRTGPSVKPIADFCADTGTSRADGR